MRVHRSFFAAIVLILVGVQSASAQNRPNILFILADDLGYGDVGCYNPASKIKTPNLDRLAQQGMRFTDAHTPSGVCSPTRYGVLTGRYAWRTLLKSGVLGGYSTPLIAPGRATVASFLRENGYRTAAIGKWHLGMHFATTDFDPPDNVGNLGGQPTNINWAGRIIYGPTAVGFDSYFGCSASWDMPPYAWIRDDRFVASSMVMAPSSPAQKSGARSVFGRAGAMSPGMKPEAAIAALAEEAVAFLRRSADPRGKPFFLYLPLTSPHTPIAPSAAFNGRSGAGAYGDFVVETDDAVGRVLQALEQTGLAPNTLVLVTSDNGPENPMHARKTEFNHFSAGKFRGNKRDNWEGGHRVPFIARWPGKVKPATASNEIICLTDLMATCAAIVGQRLPANAGEDSYDLLPVLRGEKLNRPLREATVHHSSSGKFAIRQGKWKLLLHPGSGGNDSTYQRQKEYAAFYQSPVQLYDIAADPEETRNLAPENAAVVTRLTEVLRTFVVNGRSTPGNPQSNDTPNDWAQLDWMKP